MKEIKVTVRGEITEDLKKNYNKRLAIALMEKWGIEGIKYILKEVANENKSDSMLQK